MKQSEKLLLRLLSIGFLILPFVFWPWARITHEVPRVWFVIGWVEILAAISLTVVYLRKTKNYGNPWIVRIILLFIASAVISSVYGIDFNKSLWGNYYRADGLLMLIHLVGFSFVLQLTWKKHWNRYITLSIITGSSLVSLWTIIEGFRWHMLGIGTAAVWNGAVGISFGNPNFLAGYLIVTLPFFIYYLTLSKDLLKQRIILACLTIQCIAIVLTYSRAGIIGIVLFGILYVIVHRKKQWIQYIPLLYFVIAVSYISFSVFQYQKYHNIAPGSRQRIFYRTIRSALKRPITGWGWANVDYAIDDTVWPLSISHDVYVDKAHSNFLEVFTTTGIIGLSLYVSLTAYIFYYYKKGLTESNQPNNWSKTILVVFLLFIFHSQTNVISIGEELFFWFIAGVTMPSS